MARTTVTLTGSSVDLSEHLGHKVSLTGFDAFPDEPGRSAHLSGRVAAALGEKASELLTKPPTIERVDVLAVKLPQ